MKLSELEKGCLGTVISLSTHEISIRLLEVGILPGSTVKVISIAPGGPLYIQIENNLISLRRTEAEHVIVEKI